jgi:hypothetical protein
MTKEERSAAAKRAAAARWSLPRATHDGELKFGDIALPCYVLEDGTRVISQRQMISALGMSYGGAAGMGADRLTQFTAGKAIKPFINSELGMRIQNPIRFAHPSGGTGSYGYEGTILADLCKAVLEARDAGAIRANQRHIAAQCDILLRGFAKVGIIALIDEATGYQDVRDRLALQQILEKYITDEWAKWTKTFPDDYYREMFRLAGLDYPRVGNKKPGFIGHWTNDIVYKRLAPGVLNELKKKNPKRPSGGRARAHHQHLTRDYGHPKLKEHLSNLIFLMRGCESWKEFKRRLERACPKVGDTIPMDLGD